MSRSYSPVVLAEVATVTVVALWLVHALLSSPGALAAVVALALIPLAFVALPALVVGSLADGRSVTVRVRLPVTVADDPDPVALTDGGQSPDERDSEN